MLYLTNCQVLNVDHGCFTDQKSNQEIEYENLLVLSPSKSMIWKIGVPSSDFGYYNAGDLLDQVAVDIVYASRSGVKLRLLSDRE